MNERVWQPIPDNPLNKASQLPQKSWKMKSGTVPDTTSRTQGTIHSFRNGLLCGPFLQGHKGECDLNQSKDDFFVKLVVKNNNWNNGDRHKRTCEVNRMSENISFIITCYVKNVPVYDFELVCVVLHPSAKEFFKAIHWQEQNNDALFIESFWRALKLHSFIFDSHITLDA